MIMMERPFCSGETFARGIANQTRPTKLTSNNAAATEAALRLNTRNLMKGGRETRDPLSKL